MLPEAAEPELVAGWLAEGANFFVEVLRLAAGAKDQK